MCRIIINADDFGLSRGVNAGILSLFKLGIVTSTSMMVNLPGYADGVQIARNHPELSIGVHLNLTYGKPLLAPELVGTLVQADGSFRPEPAQLLAEGDLAEMEKELRAQMIYGLSTGIIPTHLDTHHNIHGNRGVQEILIMLAKEYGVPTIRRLEYHPEVVCRGLRTTDYCIQIHFWEENALNTLKEHLSGIDHGVAEIVCHPGFTDQDLRKISSWTEMREKEIQFFFDPNVHNLIKKSGKGLISFAEFNHD